jgi:cytochrome c553
MGKMVKKLSIGLVVGGVLVGITRALEFPLIFQMMFFAHAMFGAAVFMLLDAGSVRTMNGGKSVIAVVVFYIVLCMVFIAGASMWPQFDPEDEKGKIAKILEPKRRAAEQGKADELIARAKALDEQVKALELRLKSLGGDQATNVPAIAAPPLATGAPPAATKVVAGDFMKLGEEQWQLHECYNCHKLQGEGGKKIRGPELDNIGSYLTVDEIKQKIFYPKSFMAEGFEKDWEKGKMPDKFKDVMEEADVVALATWLSTFKNTSVNTPRPIKKL